MAGNAECVRFDVAFILKRCHGRVTGHIKLAGCPKIVKGLLEIRSGSRDRTLILNVLGDDQPVRYVESGIGTIGQSGRQMGVLRDIDRTRIGNRRLNQVVVHDLRQSQSALTVIGHLVLGEYCGISLDADTKFADIHHAAVFQLASSLQMQRLDSEVL